MGLTWRILLSVCLIGLFIWIIGSADVATRLREARLGWVAAAIACLVAQTVLMALRWRQVALALDLSFSRRWAIAEYFVAQLINYTLPGGVAGDGARAVRSRKGEDGLKRAAQAVIVERTFGQLGLLVVLVAGVAWALVTTRMLGLWGDVLTGVALVASGIVVAGGIAFLALRGGRITALLARCLPDTRTQVYHLAVSVAAALLNVAAFMACTFAVGVSLPASSVLVIVPLVLFAMVIPLGIAGWGWREGAAAALFPLVGAAASGGIAAGILFGIALMLTNLPAIPLLLRSTRGAVTQTEKVKVADR